jgi:endonuclease YncB( thermonuclease family)
MTCYNQPQLDREWRKGFWLGLCTAFAVMLVTIILCRAASGDQPPNTPTLAPPKVSLGVEVVTLRTCEVLHNTRVIDGDTIQADICLGAGVYIENETIRLVGFDAWEATKRRRSVDVTDDEVAKGEKAKDALDSLIGNGGTRILACEGRDVYGRILGRLFVVQDDGTIVDIAARMIAGGHDRDGILNTAGPPKSG